MRLKFLLRPGWIGLILLAVVFSSLCFTLLAPWQFRRDAQTEARNAAIEESFRAPPKPLSEVLPQGRPPDQSTEWTKVTVTGHYLPAGETLAWLRTVQGEPAIEVLTPFRLNSGGTILVDRGYLRPQGTHAPPFPPAPIGQVSLTARVRSDETDAKHRPTFEREGHSWSYAIDSSTISEGIGTPLRPGYFVLAPHQPGGLSPLPLPQLEAGPYFSYALQWIAFGIMAIVSVGYLVYVELRPSEAHFGPHEKRSKSRRKSVAEAIAEEERREQEEEATRNR